jgi:hypothetical protein
MRQLDEWIVERLSAAAMRSTSERDAIGQGRRIPSLPGPVELPPIEVSPRRVQGPEDPANRPAGDIPDDAIGGKRT